VRNSLSKVLGGLALVLALAAPAAAQSTGNDGILVGLGISFLNVSDSTSNGFTVDFRKNVYNATNFDVGVVGDLSWHRESLDDEDFDFEGSANAIGIMGGVRLTASQMGRVAPFGQVLVGIIRDSVSGDLCDFLEDFDESCSSTDGAMSFGGGIDVGLNDRWNFRAQIDFIKVFVDESDLATRFFLGVSTRIGGM
jgi:hypothetical protein